MENVESDGVVGGGRFFVLRIRAMVSIQFCDIDIIFKINDHYLREENLEICELE